MFKIKLEQRFCLFVLFMLCSSSVLFAAAIPGTAGTAKLQDGPNAEAFYFEVDVHYEAFDGTSETDPLGITPGKLQFAYILEYVAGNEAVGFYNVESTNGVAIDATGTSVSAIVNGIEPGDKAPLGTAIITMPSGNPGARFVYSFFGQSQFGGVGSKTVTLVYTASDENVSGAAYGILTDNSLSASGLVIGPAPLNPVKPRSPGYWRHQYSGKGKRKEADFLGGYMNDIGVYSQVFRPGLVGDEASDLSFGNSALIELDSSVMRAKAKRQLFALWLNVTSAKIDYFLTVTFDPAEFDTTATTVGGAIEQAESVILNANATDAELENVKDMLDMLNHL